MLNIHYRVFFSSLAHLQSEPEQGGGDGGAVDGPVAPCGRQTHRVVAVHVGQEEQSAARTFPYMPKVYNQRGVRDDFPISRHGQLFLYKSQT